MTTRLHLTPADRIAIERELCRRSLADFAKRAWHVLEPTTPLKWGWALDTTPIRFDAEIASNAYALLGEYGTTLSAALMHSRVFFNLRAARAIERFKDPATGLEFDTWDGKIVYVSDQCPREPGDTSGFKYTTYLFGNGAIGYAEATGEGGPKKPVEIESNASAGNGEGVETVWYRRHWVMHPRGVSFSGTPASASGVSDTELGGGANWTRVYDPKLVRMVAVVTNG